MSGRSKGERVLSDSKREGLRKSAGLSDVRAASIANAARPHAPCISEPIDYASTTSHLRFNCERSRTAPRSAEVASAA